MFEKFRKNEEKEFKKNTQLFLEELRKIEQKYGVWLKPIITPDGPRLVPEQIKSNLPEMPQAKPYVKTNEQNPVAEVTEVSEK